MQYKWSEGDDILSLLMTFLIEMIKPFRHLLTINLSLPLISHLPLYLQDYQYFTAGHWTGFGFTVLLKSALILFLYSGCKSSTFPPSNLHPTPPWLIPRKDGTANKKKVAQFIYLYNKASVSLS